MVLGFDVYHCSERKGESVGALVATCSPDLGKYYSTTSFHKSKSELSDNLCTDTSSKFITLFILSHLCKGDKRVSQNFTLLLQNVWKHITNVITAHCQTALCCSEMALEKAK